MAARVVICPVVWDATEYGRAPKVFTMVDPGHAEGGHYVGSAIIGPGNPGGGPASVKPGELCLVVMGGFNMGPINTDSEIISLYDMPDATLDTIQAELTKTARDAGFRQGQINAVKTRIRNAGGDDEGLTLDSPLRDFAQRIANVILPGSSFRRCHVRASTRLGVR